MIIILFTFLANYSLDNTNREKAVTTRITMYQTLVELKKKSMEKLTAINIYILLS